MELSTDYMGLTLRNPLVASRVPAVEDRRRRAAPGRRRRRRGRALLALRGAAAPRGGAGCASWPRPAPRASPRRCRTSRTRPRRSPARARYLSLLERAVAAVDVPVIGSLNGVTPGGWADYARAMQDAGAAAIELNIYYLPGDTHTSGRDVEQRHLDVLARVKDAVTVPVAVKLAPVLQLDRRDGAAARRGRRGRAGALQPVPAARHRPRDARRGARASASPARRRRGCRARGSRCCADGSAPSLAATTGVEALGRRGQVPPRRRGRRHDRVGAAAARPASTRPSCSTACRSGWSARDSRPSTSCAGCSSVAPGTDEAAHERAGYVGALRAANSSAYGPW